MTRLISFDFAIKYLLKNKSNYDIVEGFISALLKEQGYSPVKIIALLDSESNKEEYSQKKSLADLIVEDENHHKYIIEIERQAVKNFVHKSCFNTSRLIVDQLDAAEDYLGIKKVFHISLLYFKIGNGPIYHGKTVMREIETEEKLTIHIEDEKTHQTYDATEIFPEYIFISIPQFNDRLESELDEWLYVMKNEEVKAEFKSPYMKKLAERLDVLRMTRSERDEYAKYVKEVATVSNAIDTARAESKAAEKREIAREMLADNEPIEKIIRYTKLSKEEIEQLKKK
jgi:predicted transposase/invertase (TIGR01784 family)